MNPVLIRLVAVLLSCLLLPVAHAASEARIDYRESLQQLEFDRTVNIDAMRFNAMGRQFDMRLAPNHRILDAATRSQLGDNIAVYRGKIAGNEDSWVRLTFIDGMPNGMFSDGVTLYAIETGMSAPDEPFIFRLDDLVLESGSFSCASNAAHEPKNAAELFLAVASDIQKALVQGPGATSNLDIDVIADQMFTDAKTDAQASMVTRINNVDGIFSSQVGVQLTIARSDVFAAANDPFSGVTDSSDLLDELSDFRRDVPSAQRGGLTHLFTGRNLTSIDPDTGEVSTGNVGIAYRGALCSRNAGAGITEARFSVTTDSLIAAHEIGHNFGAPHDGTSNSACSAEAQTFLMAPSVNGSDQFSACSIQQINIELPAPRV